jgi:hypothetical protein
MFNELFLMIFIPGISLNALQTTASINKKLKFLRKITDKNNARSIKVIPSRLLLIVSWHCASKREEKAG